MLLRTQEQMALNQVESLCVEAADHYVYEADKTDNKELSQLFLALGERHREFADALVAHIHALDDLPRSPDPDRETVDELLLNLKMFFSGDANTALIDGRLRAEERITEAVREALQLQLPEQTKALLKRIADEVNDAKAKLAAARH